MSFSVRVHPAPFSPTPNRHAGIGLKMKGGGPGGSRFELVGLLDPQRKERKRCRSPKRGRRPGAPRPPGAGVCSGVAVGWWVEERCGRRLEVSFLTPGIPGHPPPPFFVSLVDVFSVPAFAIAKKGKRKPNFFERLQIHQGRHFEPRQGQRSNKGSSAR